MQEQIIKQAKEQKFNEVILSRMGLKHISENIIELKDHLTTLDLSNNELIEIPGFITELINLEKLDLKNNKINNLKNLNFSKFKNLKILSVKGNLFEIFPKQIFELSDLQELSIARNRIDTIPSSINKLKKLKIFFADGNRIDKLPEHIADLKELVAFTISENPVSRTIEGGLCHFVGIDRVKNFIQEKKDISRIHEKINNIKFIADFIKDKVYDYQPIDKNDERMYLDTHFHDNYLSINKLINSLTFDIDNLLKIYSKVFKQQLKVTGLQKDLFILYYAGISETKILTRILNREGSHIRKERNALKTLLNYPETNKNNQIVPEKIIDKIRKQIINHFL